MYFAIFLLIIAVIVLTYKLNQKNTFEKQDLSKYQEELVSLERKKAQLQNSISNQQDKLQDLKDNLEETQSKYDFLLKHKLNEINEYVDQQKTIQEQQLKDWASTKDAYYKKLIEDTEQQTNNKIEELSLTFSANKLELEEQQHELSEQIAFERQKYESIIAPLRQLEQEEQQRRFYTIQVPDEYKSDIEFLLTNVAPKIQHPDIINKLIWNEYVKPYIEDTFKRVEITDKPGIYKITYLENDKCYIGKSTNVKKRIADHFKSTIGIASIADQAVHHEILRTGFWNWTIEVLTYCEKDQLNELEKYYIDFFDSINNGFNKNKGGGG